MLLPVKLYGIREEQWGDSRGNLTYSEAWTDMSDGTVVYGWWWTEICNWYKSSTRLPRGGAVVESHVYIEYIILHICSLWPWNIQPSSSARPGDGWAAWGGVNRLEAAWVLTDSLPAWDRTKVLLRYWCILEWNAHMIHDRVYSSIYMCSNAPPRLIANRAGCQENIYPLIHSLP